MSVDTICVMTWNVHGGIGRDGRRDFTRIVDFIARLDPDIAALQEVDSRSLGGEEPPISALKRVLGHHGVSAAAISTADGEYGQVLLSRWPLTGVEIHDLSVARWEPRRAIVATAQIPGAPLRLVSTHLGLSMSERQHQARKLDAVVSSSLLPTILMGDFNDWMRYRSVQKVLERTMPARTNFRTFPARAPLFALDKIYCRPGNILVSSSVPRDAARLSDHLPVMAKIKLLPQPAATFADLHAAE